MVTIAGAANQLLRPLHGRMPVILAPDDRAAWLGEDPARGLAEPLRPYPPEKMRARRVGAAISGARNDGPECVETTE